MCSPILLAGGLILASEAYDNANMPTPSAPEQKKTPVDDRLKSNTKRQTEGERYQRRRRNYDENINKNRDIFTTPLGLSDPAQTQTKDLLGQ